MRKLLLFLGLCCGIATASQAAFEDTNFSKYRYTVFHARYYQSSNYFYVAPLVYTVTGEGVVSVAGADLNVAEIDVPETVLNKILGYKEIFSAILFAGSGASGCC